MVGRTEVVETEALSGRCRVRLSRRENDGWVGRCFFDLRSDSDWIAALVGLHRSEIDGYFGGISGCSESPFRPLPTLLEGD